MFSRFWTWFGVPFFDNSNHVVFRKKPIYTVLVISSILYDINTDNMYALISPFKIDSATKTHFFASKKTLRFPQQKGESPQGFILAEARQPEDLRSTCNLGSKTLPGPGCWSRRGWHQQLSWLVVFLNTAINLLKQPWQNNKLFFFFFFNFLLLFLFSWWSN